MARGCVGTIGVESMAKRRRTVIYMQFTDMLVEETYLSVLSRASQHSEMLYTRVTECFEFGAVQSRQLLR